MSIALTIAAVHTTIDHYPRIDPACRRSIAAVLRNVRRLPSGRRALRVLVACNRMSADHRCRYASSVPADAVGDLEAYIDQSAPEGDVVFSQDVPYDV